MKKTLILLFLGLFIILIHNQAQNYSFEFDAAGNRTDRIIALMKSTISANTAETSGFESKEELINEIRTVISPNPTTDDVYISFLNRSADTHTEILLYDNTGRLLKRLVTPDDVCSIGLSPYPNGTYYLVILINGKSSQWKIIKQ